MIEQRRIGSRVIMKFIKHGDRIYTGACKNNLPLINGSCRWKIHRGERYEAREKGRNEESLLPSTRGIFLPWFRDRFRDFLLFYPLPSLFSLLVPTSFAISKRIETAGVKSWPERGGNERFTSEIRMARRKSISGASMIVLLIPRATLSTRENCKLPVYDISYGVRMYVCRWIRARGGHEKKGGWEGEGMGKKNRNHNPRHQSQFRAFCPDAIDALAVILYNRKKYERISKRGRNRERERILEDGFWKDVYRARSTRAPPILIAKSV